jgi:hypothetical protein
MSAFPQRVGASIPRMSFEFLYPVFQTAGLVLGGATAFYYACQNPATRLRNTLVSAVLLALAGYKILGS